MRNRFKKGRGTVPLLELVKVFGPCLNPSLTFPRPASRLANSKDLFHQLKRMKVTAAHYRMAYLTANQVESLHRMFVINSLAQSICTTDLITSQTFNHPDDYQAFINPEIVKGEKEEWREESCLTFPFIKFVVPRFETIILKYRDEKRQFREQMLTGVKGQLVQHCMSHLDGQLLLDYSLSRGKFYIEKDSGAYFPRTSFLMKEYSFRLKNHLQVNPSAQQLQQFDRMKEDYLQRLKTEYEKESLEFSNQLTSRRLNLI